MLCCLGLFAGVAVGSALGGPWTFITPMVGFGFGLVGDIKFMRFMHGGHGNHSVDIPVKKEEEKLVEDPVCGMQVDEEKADFKAEFHGKTYYFCSGECESTFTQNPERYIAA